MADNIDPNTPRPIQSNLAQLTKKVATTNSILNNQTITIDHLETKSVSPGKMKSLLEITKQLPEVREKMVEEATALIKSGFPTEDDLDRLADVLSSGSTPTIPTIE